MSGMNPDLLRTEELLKKLEQRARACPGLFPITTALEFLNLASDQSLGSFLHTEHLSLRPASDLAKLSLHLERLWRDPSLCPQQLAQALLRHQKITLKSHRAGETPHEWAKIIHNALSPTPASASETTYQSQKLRSAQK
jgi:hypothetical protein